MRRVGRVFAVAGTAALVSLMFPAQLDAQPAPSSDRSFTVTKVVLGTAPAGAQYVVGWVCGPASGTLTFTGPGTQTVAVPDPPSVHLPATCTLTEQSTGGASRSSFSCDVVTGTATCDAPNVVSYDPASVSAQQAAFTFTNIFDPPIPVVAAPVFTG